MPSDLRYRIGAPDLECQYPVILTDGPHRGKSIGDTLRWHRAWLIAPAGHDTEIRVTEGRGGKERAAAHLFTMYEAGEITPQPAPEHSPTPVVPIGPAPLLHWRMPNDPTNRDKALASIAHLAKFRFTPLSGYPGSDNKWLVRCDLCGYVFLGYNSHFRGRNGNPPSEYRHVGGCLGKDKVRALVPAYSVPASPERKEPRS